VSPQHPQQRDRAVGALVGLACGDAVGTTLEFKAPGTFAPIDDMVGGGPFRLEPGQWTDDTSMALCLAESLLDRGANDLADQLRRYVAWWRDGYLSCNGRCFDIGGTTSSQLSRFARTGEPIDPDTHPESAANGSLMRLAGVPIRWHADPDEAAAQSAMSSRSTHAARRPVDACRVLGAMTAALIGGGDAESVFRNDFWQWGPLDPAIAAVTRGSWRHKAPPAIRGTGYCVDALEAAIWAVTGADDARAAILRAANLGDDADTTAAIAGQLAGARWGMSGIPSRWRERITMSERLVSLADNLFAVQSPDTSWAHDELVHAWWVEPGRLLAGEYPGQPDPGRAALKLAVLVDAGIRTFVDLTTPDDRLAPYDTIVAEMSQQRAVDLRHLALPIRDLSVRDGAFYDDALRTIHAEVDAGRPVYVHCWGGVGRTGTVIGCWLVEHGLSGDAALERLRELRHGTSKASRSCPETHEQLELVRTRLA
jgi:ADP-ribosylglycohydrolase